MCLVSESCWSYGSFSSAVILRGISILFNYFTWFLMCVAKKWKTLQTLFCVAVFIKWFCFTLKHMQYISIALLWCVTLFPQHAKRGIIIRVSRNLLLGSNRNDYIPRLVADGFLYFRIFFYFFFRHEMLLSLVSKLPSKRESTQTARFMGGVVFISCLWCVVFFFVRLGRIQFLLSNGHIISWFGWFVAVFLLRFFFV